MEVVEELTKQAPVRENDSLVFTVKHEEVPLLINKLVERQVEVFAVNVNRATLEDKFLDLIGEGSIE